MNKKKTIKRISKYAAGASALLLGTTAAEAAAITNNIDDACFEPTTVGETMDFDVNGDGVNDLRLYAYDPSFDEVYILLTGLGGAIGVEPTNELIIYPSLSDVDFDCADGNSNSSGSVDRLDVGTYGFAPYTFNIGGNEHFGVIELTTVGGTGSQADDVRKVIVHSFTYNDISVPDGGCFLLGSLAVENLDFSAYGVDDKVVLDWQTMSEQNNSGFEIERSADGANWEKIGFESGNGNTDGRSEYTWVDHSPLAPQSYYRLRQVDYNGVASYSKVLSVKILQSKTKLELMAFPNPATDYISYDFPKKLLREHEVSVWSLEGKLILKRQVQDQGLRVVNLQELDTGSYLLNVKMGNDNYSKVIIKR